MATVPHKWNTLRTTRTVASTIYDSADNATGEALWDANATTISYAGDTITMSKSVAGNQAVYSDIIARLTPPAEVNLFTDLGIGTQYPG